MHVYIYIYIYTCIYIYAYIYIYLQYILDVVTNGLKLELNELPPQCCKSTYILLAKENEVISVEIMKLLRK